MTQTIPQEISPKERPILFSGPMVRAIHAGKKAQTRRVVKCPLLEWNSWEEESDPAQWDTGYVTFQHEPVGLNELLCPYGKVGDHLWVRETFAYFNTGRYDRPEMGCFYRADGERRDSLRGQWKPSIHMPRWASRLTLEIVSVCVERVQDISHDDCWTEGCYEWLKCDYAANCTRASSKAEEIGKGFAWGCFAQLWDSINAKRGYGWEKNPWVWVIGFQKCDMLQPCHQKVEVQK